MKIFRKMPDTNEVRSLYQDGYLHELLKGFIDAIENHKTSVVIAIDGRSGLGKTTMGNQIAITLDKDFCLHKIFYNPQEFLTGLSNAKKGDCLMFDEAMLISSRSALSSINRMIVQAMSMIRSKNIYVIFCINSIFDLDKNLAISRADLLLHIYSESLIKRGNFCAFFKGKDGRDRIKELYLYGKKFYDYNKPKANFIGTFTKEFVVDEQEYEKQKQIGVDAFLTGKIGTQTQVAYKTRNQMIARLHNEGWDVKKLMEYSGLSRTEIYKIVAKEGNDA